MTKENSLALFEGKTIRKTIHNDEWWFSVSDIIEVLTDTVDVRQYVKKMRTRDSELDLNWGTICTPLEMIAKDGKKREVNCANTEGVFRIIQSIPSPKAEPFKQWLARTGYERVKEIENPELAQERMKQLYEQKGYSKEWIDKRLRGIAVRQDLTHEWKERGAEEGRDFGILTNEIMQGAFGMKVEDYKDFKGLKKENLRDHMTDLELVFTMLGEASTTHISKARDSKGVPELKKDAKDGGKVAGDARKKLEIESKKKVISKDNFLQTPEKQKRLQK